MPVITINRFGCKEVVDNGISGFLVIEKIKRFNK